VVSEPEKKGSRAGGKVAKWEERDIFVSAKEQGWKNHVRQGAREREGVLRVGRGGPRELARDATGAERDYKEERKRGLHVGLGLSVGTRTSSSERSGEDAWSEGRES
jgi:hypothetical protein